MTTCDPAWLILAIWTLVLILPTAAITVGLSWLGWRQGIRWPFAAVALLAMVACLVAAMAARASGGSAGVLPLGFVPVIVMSTWVFLAPSALARTAALAASPSPSLTMLVFIVSQVLATEPC